MSEELYFYKLDNDKRPDLLRAITVDDTYKEYVKDDEDVDFSVMQEKLGHRLEDLTEDEFFSIWIWVRRQIDKSDPNVNYRDYTRMHRERLHPYGMDWFFEIDSTTPTRKFNILLIEYECFNDILLPKTCDAATLMEFAYFGLCHSSILMNFLNEHFYQDGIDQEVTDTIAHCKRRNELQYEHAMELFNENIYKYERLIELMPPLRAFRQKTINQSVTIPHELLEVYRLEDEAVDLAFLDGRFKMLIEGLGSYNGMVTRLHSW